MVSVTLAIPDEVRQKMNEFPEMNWSGFIRQSIIEKTKELEWREKMLKQLKKEEHLDNWAVDLQKKARKGRAAQLK